MPRKRSQRRFRAKGSRRPLTPKTTRKSPRTASQGKSSRTGQAKSSRNRSSRSRSLRLPGRKREVTPIWDLDRDGITYTGLSKFIYCPERFRLWAVEGWSESGIRVPLEFGSAFHYCLEMAAAGHGREEIPRLLKVYLDNRARQSSSFTADQITELSTLLEVVYITWKGYVDWWGPDDASKNYIIHEKAFAIPHTLPSGRVVTLRGRWDEAYRDLSKAGAVFLQENKTKANIDQVGLQASLSQDLQTMFYAYTLSVHLREPIGGILYNVIRRPGLRQGKRETTESFLARIEKDISSRPEWYYLRWDTDLHTGDIERWVHRQLDPLLVRIVRWWDSIKDDPINPWTRIDEFGKKVRNLEHTQRPFGVYDGSYDRGDFFELLTRGSYYGLIRRKLPFPELEDAEEPAGVADGKDNESPPWE